jgi:hypothetical protein
MTLHTPTPPATTDDSLEEVLMALFEKNLLTLDTKGQIILTPEGWAEVDRAGREAGR